MEFGGVLREFRSRAGWTQEDLAERSGISVHAISVLESGKRRPRPSSVARLASALGLVSEESELLIAAARGAGPQPAGVVASPVPLPLPLPMPAEAASSAVRPRNDLPRPVADFTGRVAELARLVEEGREQDGSGVLVISAIDGMAGIGKTALAVQAAHALAPSYPDGQLFVDLHGYTAGREPVDAGEALRRLLVALGVADRQVPAEVEERAALWRSELAGRRVLVVLDNAADAGQVVPLLPGASECLVLVTSRRRLVALEGARSLSLDVLSATEGEELFAAVAGPAADGCGPDVAEAVRLCGFLPLAIRLAAARLRHRPSWSVADLVERLREQLADVGPDGGPVGGGRGGSVGGGSEVAAAFGVSHGRLEPELRRMFGLLGLHPGGQVDAFAAGALAGVSRRRAEALLEDLMDDHLIGQPRPGRYAFHDLLRDHARRTVLAQEDEPARRSALTGLFDYYRHVVSTAIGELVPHEQHLKPVVHRTAADVPEFEEAKSARAWLDTERANLLDMARHTEQPGWPGYASDLSALLYRYFELYAHPSEAVALHTHALNASAADPARRAHALRRLGSEYGRTGNYEQSRACLEAALSFYCESGDRVSEAAARGNLGIVLWNLGQADEAVDHTSRSCALLAELGDRQAHARTASNLGGLHWFLGHGESAVEYLQQALAVFRELGIRASETYTLNTLGIISLESGRYREAISRFELVFSLAREIGDRRVEGAALHGFGAAQTRLGRHGEALEALTRGLDLATGMGDRVGEGDLKNQLGVVHRNLGEHEQAADWQQQALGLFQGIGHRPGEAEALAHLGDTCRLLGRPDQAQEHLAAALALSRDLGVRNTEALALVGLGDTADDSGDPDRAVAWHLAAIEVPGADPYFLARAHEGLARAYADLGKPGDAAAHRDRALGLYGELGVPEAVFAGLAGGR